MAGATCCATGVSNSHPQHQNNNNLSSCVREPAGQLREDRERDYSNYHNHARDPARERSPGRSSLRSGRANSSDPIPASRSPSPSSAYGNLVRGEDASIVSGVHAELQAAFQKRERASSRSPPRAFAHVGVYGNTSSFSPRRNVAQSTQALRSAAAFDGWPLNYAILLSFRLVGV